MDRKYADRTVAAAHGLTLYAQAVWRRRRQRVSWLLAGRASDDWTDEARKS